MTEASKPLSRAQLEQRIHDLEQRAGQLHGELNQERIDRVAAGRSEKETRAQFNDLKERLANAEAETQRMRGYIARVQEDDVVREELVRTGDPAGEQQLVPKRKPTSFEPRPQYTDLRAATGIEVSDRWNRERPPPRHWVTY